MPELEVLQSISSGLRGAIAILWVTFLLRLASNSKGATNRPVVRREKAWQLQRAGFALLGASVVLFYSPEDVLRAEGMISQQVSFAMGCAGNALQALAMASFLSGLDVLTTGRLGGSWVYIAVVLLFPLCVVVV